MDVPVLMACPHPTAHDEVPYFVQAWVRQLLDPELAEMLRAADGRQVEVRLLASPTGKVRRRPEVLFDSGRNLDMVEPGDVG